MEQGGQLNEDGNVQSELNDFAEDGTEDIIDGTIIDDDPDESFEILETDDDSEKKIITKLFQVCRTGQLEKLKTLSKTFPEKKMKKLLQNHDDKYNIPLHYAAMNSHYEILQYLHDKFKLKVDELGQNKMIALHFAGRYGKVSPGTLHPDDKTWKTINYLLHVGGSSA